MKQNLMDVDVRQRFLTYLTLPVQHPLPLANTLLLYKKSKDNHSAYWLYARLICQNGNYGNSIDKSNKKIKVASWKLHLKCTHQYFKFPPLPATYMTFPSYFWNRLQHPRLRKTDVGHTGARQVQAESINRLKSGF